MKEFDLEKFPTSESGRRQLGYVSENFYEKSYVGKWLFQVMGMEYDEVRRIVEELPEQMFIETATWGLKYHEVKWQLPVRESLSYEERRKLIYQKRDARSPMTPYRMERHLRDITDFEVHVSDIHDGGDFFVKQNIFNGAWVLDGSVLLNQGKNSFPHPNIFRVVFIGVGDRNLNIGKIKKALNRIKQSHTYYILREWVIIGLNNQYLEKVNLKSLEIRLGMPFFMLRRFNGSWLLDGAVPLCQSVICSMNMRIILGLIRIIITGSNVLSSSIGFSLPLAKVQNVLEKIRFRLELSARYASRPQEIGMAVYFEEQEVFEDYQVTIRKDLWFVDGMEVLDGTRLLDAEIRRESL